MVSRKEIIRFLAIVASLFEVNGQRVGLRGGATKAVPRQLGERDDGTRSCEGGLVVHVKPPWEDMDAYVEGASSLESCQVCAHFLEDEGYLMSGWKCYSWWSRVYLKRDGDSTLTAIKPLHSFSLADVDGA